MRSRRRTGSIRAKDVVDSVQDDHPELRIEQFGSVSSNKELNDTFSSDLARRRCSRSRSPC